MKRIVVSLKFFLFFTLLCGVVYPLFLTLFGQVFYPKERLGSLMHNKDGHLIGSKLIGQNFTGDRSFHGRPSASNYDPMPSKASHLPLSSEALKDQVAQRKAALAEPIPSELLLASGSGLDPHISLEAAVYQLERVAEVRGLDEGQKQELLKRIHQMAEGPFFAFLGPKVVSVLELNLFIEGVQLQVL